MSKTLAIVGAGPVLGRSLARRFGREGFRVALIARTRPKLDTLVAELAHDGIEATAVTADLTDQAELAAAIEQIGPIDVAEFSPGGGNTGEGIVSVLDVDPSNLQLILDRFLIPAVALVRAVLPGMIQRRDGAILFTAGQSGVYPKARMGNMGMAQAALRNYFLNLNGELAGTGVYVGAVNIGALIEGSVPHQLVASLAGPNFRGEVIHPDVYAEHFWDRYAKRDKPEVLVGNFNG
ncbi:MAG TPA: SDR family oxidoreductase [Pseudonocardiaceae bacterium]|jgi:short-subunit dehydrogenase|nr:SDR family oxidoreductase [Pseudonocardiaceae bacterium]